MRIDAIFTKETAGAMSGAWVSFDRLCRGAARAGHQVEVLTWPETPPPGPGGPAEAAARLRASCADFAARLEQRWRASRPDVVHLELAGNIANAALGVAARLRLPTVSAFHHMHLYAPAGQREHVLGLLAGYHRRCAITVAQSRASRDLLLGAGGPVSLVIPDGIDSEAFHPRRRDPGLRRGWGAGPDDPILFWAGRMVPTKGLDLFVEAARAVLRAVPGTRVVLAGAGELDGWLRQALPEATFLGVLRGEPLAVAYASADVFLFPSPEEPWGNAVMEAAASGLAVVARSGGAAAEVLLPAGACVAPLPREPAAFIAAATALAGDGQARAALAMAGRAAAERLSFGSTVDGWIAAWTAARRSAD